MKEKQINEFLAENMFGLVRQKDFGEWPEHDWERKKDGTIDDFAFDYGYCNGPACKRCFYSFCMHCEDDYEKALKDGLPCIVEAPNYIKAYEPVLKKAEAIVIKKQSNKSSYEVYFNGCKAEDKDLGRAICLSAISYLKEVNNERN